MYEVPYNPQSDKIIEFAKRLKLNDDFWGEPFVPRPWQEMILRRTFGTLDKDQKRIITKLFLLLPRKSAKTYLTAIVCLYALLTFGKNQVVISAAGSQKQAFKVFEAMQSIIKQDAFLSSILKCFKSGRITYDNNFSYYQAVTSSGSSNHGENCTVFVADEFHAFVTPAQRKTYEALTTGRGSRKEPLTILISTQTNDPYSLCGEEFAYASEVKGRIVNGEVIEDGIYDNPSYLSVLYYASPEDNWHDRNLWHKVSPALGDYLSIKEVEEVYRQAVEFPSRADTFKTLYLNMPAQDQSKWLPLDLLKACYETNWPSVDELKKARVYCGLDIAPIRDLSCLAVLYDLDGQLYLEVFTWCDETSIRERTKFEKVPYQRWKESGFIIATTNEIGTADFVKIEKDIAGILNGFDVRGFGVDMAYAVEMAHNLAQKDIPVEWFIQGFKSFGPSVARMEKLIRERRLHIQPNPVLEYCINNTRMDKCTTTDNQKPSNKQRQKNQKIDAAVASIMAVGKWLEDQNKRKGSVYDNPDTPICI